MQKIVKENHRFERMEAQKLKLARCFKRKMIPEMELFEEFAGRGEQISFYKDGDFVEMCRGPHVRFTNQVKHFQLLEVAGAYWRRTRSARCCSAHLWHGLLHQRGTGEVSLADRRGKERDHQSLAAS